MSAEDDKRDLQTKIGAILDRMTVVETVIFGADKISGINGAIKKNEIKINNLEKNDSSLNDPDIGVNAQLKEIRADIEQNKDSISILKAFKLKLITGYGVLQAVILGIIYLISKFNLFNGK